jgi:hypothetical protein
LIYIFSLFAKVQAFHHYSYLMLPFYLCLLFIWTSLKTNRIFREQGMISPWRVAALFLLCVAVTFTGEYSLSMLGYVLVCLIIYAIRTKSKPLGRLYGSLLVFFIAIVVGWVLLWKLVLCHIENKRYGLVSSPDIIGGAHYFLLSIWNAVKDLLHLNNVNAAYDVSYGTVRNAYALRNGSLPLLLLVLLCSGAFILNAVKTKRANCTSRVLMVERKP